MSEREPQSETNLAFHVRRVGQRRAAGDPRDLPERARREVPGRVGEHRPVQNIPRFDARFEPPLSADREGAEQREIEAVTARTVELIPPGVAEADAGRLLELRGIEPRAG